MAAALLDTNAMVWFLAGAPLEGEALFAIAQAQARRRLFVSPVTAWEAALAAQKPSRAKRPDLLGDEAASWFKAGRARMGARLAAITEAVALEAARVPDDADIKDPGDCFIVATARVNGFRIVTRDARMLQLAKSRPDYLDAVRC